MSTFVLIPGAGGTASFWYRVVPLLEAAGHEAIAVGLPGPDESAGLPEYASLVAAAIGGRRDVVLVAQSMGAFTAPMVCARVPVDLLVLVNAMIPRPGETPGEWGATPARKKPGWLPPGTAGTRERSIWRPISCTICPPRSSPREQVSGQPEADIAFGQPCAIDRWPAVPTRVISGRDDRLFPLEFQRRVAKDRLGARRGRGPRRPPGRPVLPGRADRTAHRLPQRALAEEARGHGMDGTALRRLPGRGRGGLH